MKFAHETAFQRSLRDFVAFVQSGSYGPHERDYKVACLNALGRTLTEAALAAPDFPAELREAVRRSTPALNNLTHFTSTDDFRKYLDRAAPERLRDLLQALLYGPADLAKRIDSFKRAVEADYAELLGKRKQIPLGLITLLLAARFPEQYIIYRWEPIKKAMDLWGIKLPPWTSSNGTRYASYLDPLKSIQEHLTAALGRPADLIDLHSLLWVTYSDRGDGGEPIDYGEVIQRLLEVTAAPRTRNIILYGPPGTGKTYWVRRFCEAFLGHQMETADTTQLDPDWGLR